MRCQDHEALKENEEPKAHKELREQKEIKAPWV